MAQFTKIILKLTLITILIETCCTNSITITNTHTVKPDSNTKSLLVKETTSVATNETEQVTTSVSLKGELNSNTQNDNSIPPRSYALSSNIAATTVSNKELNSTSPGFIFITIPIRPKIRNVFTTTREVSTDATKKPLLSTAVSTEASLLINQKAVKEETSEHHSGRLPSRLEERLESLDCDIPLLPAESRLWRGNETHELSLPIMIPEECSNTLIGPGSPDDDCLPVVLSWEGSADIQSGDILIVRINDKQLTNATILVSPSTTKSTTDNDRNRNIDTDRLHHLTPQPAVYQVTRQGHEHCDVTEGVMLDITPLTDSGGVKLVTLYDKDLTEGVNLLIVVAENWGSQCVRLKVTVKSDNCGDTQDCSSKGVCYTNISMEGYECQCCPGFVGPHCEEQDACFPTPCTNNGICVDISQGHDGSTYQCLCPYGYTGKNCQEEVDPCSSSPCQNVGQCLAGNATHFRCECGEGFTGELCEVNASAALGPLGGRPCNGSPCVHGICVDESDSSGVNAYKCFCRPGFAGIRCEYEYNECESMPCMNGGTCTDHVGGYTCTCGRGYTGLTCNVKVDLCSPNPCLPHRYCIDRGNSYSCECPRGYEGTDCILPVKEACSNSPCFNGGTCWSGFNSFYCACRAGYTGKYCEDDFIVEQVIAEPDSGVDGEGSIVSSVREVRLPVSLYRDRLHNVYIAAGTLGTAIFIVAVVVMACHCRVNKTYSGWVSRLSQHPRLARLSRMTRRKTRCHTAADSNVPHHWLSDKPVQHGRHATCPPLTPPPPMTRHLYHPSIDTHDMYYTLDFSDRQNEPLIQ